VCVCVCVYVCVRARVRQWNGDNHSDGAKSPRHTQYHTRGAAAWEADGAQLRYKHTYIDTNIHTYKDTGIYTKTQAYIQRHRHTYNDTSIRAKGVWWL
jgi:hypothetical protein